MLRLKRFVPSSLLWRTLLIVLVPLLVVQAVALQVFYGPQSGLVARRLSAAVVGEIAMTVNLLETEPDPARRESILRLARDLYEMRMELHPAGPLPAPVPPGFWTSRNNGLGSGLREKLGHPVAIDWATDPLDVLIDLRLNDAVLHIAAPRKRLLTGTFPLFLAWLVGSSVLMFGLASVFVRNQVKSIRRIARAAEAFGLGRDVGPIKPQGAAEVRLAANAFNRMQERVSRFMRQRTEMLAGVSHDLRTPLTRLRLALAMLPQDEAIQRDVADMTGDVAEMERLVDSYLAFARGEGAEQARAVELAPLLEEIAAAARRANSDVACDVPADLVLPLRADAIRRAVTNLVDNARRHGTRVVLAARPAGERHVDITIDDNGPGLPPDHREAAFKPFESGTGGGTGLGLTIARDIVRAHGGDIALEDSPLGGLRARIWLPT